jgi:hypothetical protein
MAKPDDPIFTGGYELLSRPVRSVSASGCHTSAGPGANIIAREPWIVSGLVCVYKFLEPWPEHIHERVEGC